MRDILLTFDTETTSNKPETARVVQVGGVATYLEGNYDHVVVETICNPGVAISPEAEKVHGYSQAMVENAIADTQACRELCQFICDNKDRVVLAAHNGISFDVPIIWRVAEMEPVRVPIVDTLVCALRTLPFAKSHKLSELVEELNLGSAEGAHDAMADIAMVQNLVKYFSEGLKKNWEEIAEWVAEPRILKVCHFGKHKGKLWGRPPNPAEKDKYVPYWYIKFMCDNFDPTPDLIATIKAKYNMRFVKQEYQA